MTKSILVLVMGISILSCSQDPPYKTEYPIPDKVDLTFPEMEFSKDNAPTDKRIELGKKLFFDPIMSRDSTKSCASCHQPKYAFASPEAVSPGILDRLGTRNAPTLTNTGFQKSFHLDGGIPTLEFQVGGPIQEFAEFDFNILKIAERMKRQPDYVLLSWEAYQRDPDPYVITRAIASYERTLISDQSPFDRLVKQGEGDLSTSALQGMELFYSDSLNCSSCHTGFNFSDGLPHNNGLYLEYEDPGRYRITHDSADLALFKTPTLRNIELTGPYMHNGKFETLEAVIENYMKGGKSHPNQSPEIRPFHLTSREKQALIDFLHSLTDQHFIDAHVVD